MWLETLIYVEYKGGWQIKQGHGEHRGGEYRGRRVQGAESTRARRVQGAVSTGGGEYRGKEEEGDLDCARKIV